MSTLVPVLYVESSRNSHLLVKSCNGTRLELGSRWRRRHASVMDTSTTAAAVVGSFILTHILMACMQRLRLRRIERKSLELCEEPVAAPSAGDAARLPITVVTGFLGSGKTTLVNRVLTGGHGRRVVVIENEVGAISIDHELIDEAAQARAPAGVRVFAVPCVGSDTYLREQMRALVKDGAVAEVLMPPPPLRVQFAEPAHSVLGAWNEACAAGVLLDLVYGPIAWAAAKQLRLGDPIDRGGSGPHDSEVLLLNHRRVNVRGGANDFFTRVLELDCVRKLALSRNHGKGRVDRREYRTLNATYEG